MRYLVFPLLICAAAFLGQCCTAVPESAVSAGESAVISPDYTEVYIPYNISPLNFTIVSEGDRFITRISGDSGDEILVNGKDVKINAAEWKKLLDANKGGEVHYVIYVRRNGEWKMLDAFSQHIVAEPVDEYLTYRLLPPSYEYYSIMSIVQRNLTTGKDREIFNNRRHYEPNNQQCMNCHNFQNYSAENWQMHIRQKFGGTLVVTGDKFKKVSLKTSQTASAGIYPAWHPTDNVIMYSVSKSRQFFHEKGVNRLEVQDAHSDLIIYDIDANTVSKVAADTAAFEIFPTWSPDGNTLYFASARQPEIARLPTDSIAICYEDIHFDLMKMDYDRKSKSFSNLQVVFNADSTDQSAVFPRISPDGRYILFSLGSFGSFHIWHPESDLWVKNLETGESYPLTEANSEYAESFHSWSSNGRWIVFTSRRDDGLFTRIYFTYFDSEGKSHKSFMLPQTDPSERFDNVLSYNVPEFTKDPIKWSERELSRMIESDAVPAGYLVR